MKVIHVTEALEEMKGDVPFTIVYVTCDEGRKTGGEIMKLENVLFSFNQKGASAAGFEMPEPPSTGFSKNPNHYEHASRNVRLQNGLIRKFHIRLLLYFNGQKVFY